MKVFGRGRAGWPGVLIVLAGVAIGVGGTGCKKSPPPAPAPARTTQADTSAQDSNPQLSQQSSQEASQDPDAAAKQELKQDGLDPADIGNALSG